METVVKKLAKTIISKFTILKKPIKYIYYFITIIFEKLKYRDSYIYYKNIIKKHINCPLCQANNTQVVYEGDRYYMGIKTVICNYCKMIFSNPQSSYASIDEFYLNSYCKFYL